MKKISCFALLLTSCLLFACNNNNPSSSIKDSSSFVNQSSLSEESSSSNSEVSSSKESVSSSSSKQNTVTIIVVSGSGSGTYNIGDVVTVVADTKENYEFIGWYENDNLISSSSTYTFLASRDITLTATYKEISSSFGDVDTMLNHLSSIEDSIVNKIISENKVIRDNKVTSEYKEENITSEISYYLNAKKAVVNVEEPSAISLKNYGYQSFKVREDNIYYDIKKHDIKNVNVKDYAKKYNVVDVVSNDKEVTPSMIESDTTSDVVSLIREYANKYFKLANTTYEETTIDNVKSINLTSSQIVETFYIIYQLSFEFDNEKTFINSLSYEEKHYVKATQVDSEGHLIENAEAKKTYVNQTIYFDGTKENINDFNHQDYFISSFDVEASYYDKNTRRTFSSTYLYLPIEAELSIYDFDIVIESILPLTYAEEAKITSITTSNEAVAKFENNKLKTYFQGMVDISFILDGGASKTYTVEVKPLAPGNITIIAEDKVEIGQRIPLSVEVSPITSSSDVIYTLNNERAVIVEENGIYYLEGVAIGDVEVKATSRLDGNVFGTKLISVTAGELSSSSLEASLIGTWQNKSEYSNTIRFEIVFSSDKTFTIMDNYRGNAAKITGNGNYNLTENFDESIDHSTSNYEVKTGSYIVEVTDYVLTGANKDEYYVKLHFAFDKDGSLLTLHMIGGYSPIEDTNTKYIAFEFRKVS